MGVVARDYARGRKKEDFEVEVFHPQQAGRVKGVTQRNLIPILKWGHAAVLPGLIWHLKPFDIIHLHYPFYGSALLAVAASRIWNIPLVTTYHMKTRGSGWLGAIFTLYRKLLEPIVLKYTDILLISSKDYAKSINIKHSYLIEMPFAAKDLKRKEVGPSGNVRIIFIGGLDSAHYFKGLDLLIEACTSISQRKDWHLTIVGDGERREEFEALAKRRGIKNRITFTGRISDTELEEELSRSDLHILPSIDRSEAFGLVTLEAMASGIPSIVTNLPGVRTLVEHGKTGMIIAPGDGTDLRNAIVWMLQNKEAMSTFGKAARHRAQTVYAAKRLNEKLDSIYKILHRLS
jgi:glycosyltransferase involved in cell wall biosynthesis